MGNLIERARSRRVRLPGLFSAPVTIDQVAIHDDRALLSVRTSEGKLEEIVLPIAELEQRLEESQATAAATDGLVPGTELFPVLESSRIRLAFAHDPYFAVSLSGVAALPHQLEAVYERMLPQPRLRFLLADDPGAGKTIMAGLLIKELKLRGVIERVLILSPAPLTLQWQDELYERFDEPFIVVDSHIETRQAIGNYWQNTPLCIASMDYAKRDERDGGGRSVRDAILQVPWDLVIVDEAHKCSARYEGQSIRPTKRYQLVEELSRRTDRLLLLTATPHQGKDTEFGLFLRLLDPDQFVDARDMDETKRLLREKDCPFFLRRMKEDLRDFQGRKLFVPRQVHTEDFILEGDELVLYQEVTTYVQQFLGRTPTGKRKATVNLARSVLQRRLASSAHAITASLERRRDKLALLVADLEKLPQQEQERRLREAGILDQDDEQDAVDRDENQQEQAATQATAAESIDMLRREVAELRRLCAFAAQVRDDGHEAKLNKLMDCVTSLHLPELPEGEARLLIFTEHRDTLDHLEKTLKKDYSVITIHGGHSAQERKERRRQFLQEKQICIATEAAGEGVNLQFCHLMINYDVPWNPMRLEQRMGRIHRIGQRRAVDVFNFVATNTEEGKVLAKLLEKLKTIQERLGDRVYDVVGSLLRENNIDLEDMMRQVLLNPRRSEDFVNEVEQLSEERLQQFEESTGVALARRHVDLSPLQKKTQVHEDLRLMPEYVERFFREGARTTGLRVDDRADGFLRIDPVPARFRSPALSAVTRFGQARDRYPKLTFRKDQRRDRHQDADLLSPGHPLYAALVEILLQKLGHAQGGTALFLDPGASAPYQIHVFEVQVLGEDAGEDRRQGRDVVIDARFVPVIQQPDGRHEVASQDIFHDLSPLDLRAEAGTEAAARASQGGLVVGPADPDAVRKATTWLRLHLQHDMVQKARERRGTDARIKREYLERAFDTLLLRKTQQRFVEQERRDGGDITAAGRLSMIDDNIQQIEMRRDDRLRTLSRLEVARAGAVIHLGTALVVPLPEGDTAQLMHSDPEVERVAVERAMAHERERGFDPEYVGDLKDGRGYDILSWGPQDDSGGRAARRIEVKGRAADRGDVALSRNEWIKAQRLGPEYWLYVVYGARPGGAQRLVIIQDPARALGPEARELVVVQGYLVPGTAIARAGRGADQDG